MQLQLLVIFGTYVELGILPLTCRDNNCRIGGYIIWNIDVHIDVGGILAKVCDLLQAGTYGEGHRAGKYKEIVYKHCERKDKSVSSIVFCLGLSIFQRIQLLQQL